MYPIPRQAITAVRTDEGWNNITTWVEGAHAGNYGRVGCVEVTVGWSKW